MRFQVDVYHRGDLNQTLQKRFLFETWHEVEMALNILFPFISYLKIIEISITIEEEEKKNV
jgi:hypothetical protein